MILIDETYFVGNITLPNLSTLPPVPAASGVALAIQTVGENNLDAYINIYVPKYLILLFGRKLASKLLEELEGSNPDQIWLDIKDQLLITTGSYKASPLANYVYYWVRRNGESKTTQGGEADPTFGFATNTANRRKIVTAWGDMVDMTRDIDAWYCANRDTYKEYACCRGRDICDITTYINEFGL